MKCDNLKSFIVHYDGKFIRVYSENEADVAIAKLQAENAQLKKEIEFMHSNCKWHAGDGCSRLLGEKLSLINDITELKQKLEDAKATAYADSVDAGMENRKQKRALWLAREWRAWCEGHFWFALESDKPRDVYHLLLTKRIHRTPNEWTIYWQKVEQLCQKKAEEYK